MKPTSNFDVRDPPPDKRLTRKPTVRNEGPPIVAIMIALAVVVTIYAVGTTMRPGNFGSYEDMMLPQALLKAPGD